MKDKKGKELNSNDFVVWGETTFEVVVIKDEYWLKRIGYKPFIKLTEIFAEKHIEKI